MNEMSEGVRDKGSFKREEMQFWTEISKWEMEKVELGLVRCLEMECMVYLVVLLLVNNELHSYMV